MPQAPARQFAGIFISYRRDDTAGHAGRLYDNLSARFGDDQVFMDIDQIEPGEDFVQVIEAAVGACEILIALIGRTWLTSHDDAGRRLDNPNDFVRLEIAAALARNIRVIPVLVQGAHMPRPQDLPEDLRPLARRHALELSDLRWKHDIEQLSDALEKVIARQREARLKAEQEEAERQRREVEARQQAEEKERREQAAAVETQRQRRADEAAEQRKRESQGIEGRQPAAPRLTTASEASSVSHPMSQNRATWPATKTQPQAARAAAIIAVIVLGIIGIAIVTARFAADRWYGRLGNDNSPPGTTVSNLAPQPTPTSTQPAASPTPFTNSAGIEFVWIPPGSFMMGSESGLSNEKPVHRVTIAKGFYLGKYEVTQAQWQKLMGGNPSRFKSDDRPVESVSWDDAAAFIAKLNAQNDGYTYRLPSEAEWEYACRAGTTTEFAFGDALSSAQANFDKYPYGATAKGVYREKTTPVGSFQPNVFGLYDMHGNVGEWVQDMYHDSYNDAPTDGSAWLTGGEQNWRVARGGSWVSAASNLRCANRDWRPPDKRGYTSGLRVVAVVRK